jgi:Kef-type K+ transport system membrane component KefB
LGGLPLFNGEPLVVLDETVKHMGEISAIVILFIAGLEITPREFLRGGAAGIAAFIGLSPIVGAFSVGMAVASTRVIKQIGEYVSKLEIIFAPLFFAIIGAQVDLRGININVLYLAGLIVAIAIITKLIGCGIPSMIFLKDKSKAMKVGIGMISRGEVGLIIAGVGVSSGVLASDTYTSIIIMVAATTIITPIWLKIVYKKEEQATSE